MEKETIQNILSHPIYSQMITGIERSDGILGELLEEEIIDEEKYNSLVGKKLKIDTTEEVLNLINK